jgi:hypothetical protein
MDRVKVVETMSNPSVVLPRNQKALREKKKLEEENEKLRRQLAENRKLNHQVTEYAMELEKQTLFPR